MWILGREKGLWDLEVGLCRAGADFIVYLFCPWPLAQGDLFLIDI